MKTTKSYVVEDIIISNDINILLQESFASGTAVKIVQKLGSVINNKCGTKFIFTTIPMAYQNGYGSFAGYLGNDDSNGLMIKINFSLSGSDSIVSFDVYLDGFSSIPSYTVDTDGLNIVEIVNTITENLVDDGEVNEYALSETSETEIVSRIVEKGMITNEQDLPRIIGIWVKENREIVKDLQKMSVPDIFNELWQPWVEDKPNYETKYYLFAKGLKMYLLQNGLNNKTFKPRKKGSAERPVTDPVLEAQFMEVVDAITWEDKFEFLDGVLDRMFGGHILSLYLYGSPGSGKSFEVVKKLDDANVEYKIYKGSVINSKDDLLRILYNNREDTILVFDDADASLRVDPNIWKTILDNGVEQRIITDADVNRYKNKNLKDIPAQFEFTSFVIFISNSPKLNSAIASRAFVLEISLSNDQMLEKIEKTMKDFLPDVELKMKMEALEYAREISPGVKNLDYRVIEKIIQSMQISPTKWRKNVLWMLQSI